MKGLLKVDLKKIFFSKYMYIVIAFFSLFYLFSYLTSPQLALNISMEEYIGGQLFSGNILVILICVMGSIIICNEYTNGTVKSIFLYNTKREKYIFSKFFSLSAALFLYMICFAVFIFIGSNYIGEYHFESLQIGKHGVLMLLLGFLGLVGVIAQNIFWCMLTRNSIISAIVSILVGMGTISDLISSLFHIIGLNIEKLFLSYGIHQAYEATKSLFMTIGIDLFWIVIYLLMAVIVVRKKDVC